MLTGSGLQYLREDVLVKERLCESDSLRAREEIESARSPKRSLLQLRTFVFQVPVHRKGPYQALFSPKQFRQSR